MVEENLTYRKCCTTPFTRIGTSGNEIYDLKERKHYQTRTLLQMDSAECGVDRNGGKSVVGELVGTAVNRFGEGTD